jgi:hypothetical protein
MPRGFAFIMNGDDGAIGSIDQGLFQAWMQEGMSLFVIVIWTIARTTAMSGDSSSYGSCKT